MALASSDIREVANVIVQSRQTMRVVRQNYGRFRMCYEQGLGRNPNLEGRVSARFVIGRDGAVSNASNGGSDLPDSGVVSCAPQGSGCATSADCCFTECVSNAMRSER